MMSTSPVERESDRLARLEREDRRLRWDSVVGAQTARGYPIENLKEDQSSRRLPSPDAGSSDSVPIIGMLVDRLERMERLALRLESELHQQERISQRRFQNGLIAVVLLAVTGGGLSICLLRH